MCANFVMWIMEYITIRILIITLHIKTAAALLMC